MTEYPGYEIERFETEGGFCCTDENRCTYCYTVEDVQDRSQEIETRSEDNKWTEQQLHSS